MHIAIFQRCSGGRILDGMPACIAGFCPRLSSGGWRNSRSPAATVFVCCIRRDRVGKFKHDSLVSDLFSLLIFYNYFGGPVSLASVDV